MHEADRITHVVCRQNPNSPKSIVTLQYNIKKHKTMLVHTDNIVIIQNKTIIHKISL